MDAGHRQPATEPSLGGATESAYERLLPHRPTGPADAGQGAVRVGRASGSCLLPGRLDRSLLYVMQAGSTAEIAGWEMTASSASLSSWRRATPSPAVVQSAGRAYQLSGRVLQGGIYASRSDAASAPSLHAGAPDATGAIRGLQSPPSLDQQLCRWLLLSRSVPTKSAGDDARVDGQYGRRAREGVTEAAGNLQDAGPSISDRGHIAVIDRAGLEARTCECYAVVKRDPTVCCPAVPVLYPTPPAGRLW